MKAIKKILLVFVALLAIVTTSSCGKDKRNTAVPFADLNKADTVASIENATLTVGDYYARLRATGYNTFYTELKKNMKNALEMPSNMPARTWMGVWPTNSLSTTSGSSFLENFS